MKKITNTSVRIGKAGASIWLDIQALSNSTLKKGDTLCIQESSNKAVKLVRSAETLPRSTPSTQNVSGRKIKGSDDYAPLLELPIAKLKVDWKETTAVKILVVGDSITIQVNDYLEERKARINKLAAIQNTASATLLDIPVNELDPKPRKNHTGNADLCSITFDPNAPKCSRFFNTLLSLEKANPIAIAIQNVTSPQNTIQDGLLSVIASFGYRVFCTGSDALAISDNLDFDATLVDGMDKTALLELIGAKNVENISVTLGNQYANKAERVARLEQDSKNGRCKAISMFHGGGCLEFGSHPIMRENGIKPELSLVSELEDNYFQHSTVVNREAFTSDTIALIGDVCEFDVMNHNIKATKLGAGISCLGASRAGLTKLALRSAECHPRAGHLFYPVLKMIASSEPCLIEIENTDSYRSTASFDGIQEFLRAMQYDFEHGIIDSNDLGTTERRRRLFLVACDSPKAIASTDIFSSKHHFVGAPKSIEMQLDPSVKDTDPSYREYTGLKLKAERDFLKGNGFSRAIYHGHETKTALIRASYVKAGSCDPYLYHPTNMELSRLFRPIENCRFSGFPDNFIQESPLTSQTHLHAILGQGINRPCANLLGEFVVASFKLSKSQPVQSDLLLCA